MPRTSTNTHADGVLPAYNSSLGQRTQSQSKLASKIYQSVGPGLDGETQDDFKAHMCVHTYACSICPHTYMHTITNIYIHT